MGYDDIRSALQNFCVANLHLVTRIGHELLDSEATLKHPSAVYSVTITAQKVASCWDGVPLSDESTSIVEAHIKPKMLAVLDAADSDAETLLGAIDDLARSYVDALPFLRIPYR